MSQCAIAAKNSRVVATSDATLALDKKSKNKQVLNNSKMNNKIPFLKRIQDSIDTDNNELIVDSVKDLATIILYMNKETYFEDKTLHKNIRQYFAGIGVNIAIEYQYKLVRDEDSNEWICKDFKDNNELKPVYTVFCNIGDAYVNPELGTISQEYKCNLGFGMLITNEESIKLPTITPDGSKYYEDLASQKPAKYITPATQGKANAPKFEDITIDVNVNKILEELSLPKLTKDANKEDVTKLSLFNRVDGHTMTTYNYLKHSWDLETIMKY